MVVVRRVVVVALLAIWCFPAVSLARSEPVGQFTTATRGAPTAPAASPRGAASDEASELAARERDARDLADWSGGQGVYFWIGSGLLLVLIVVLLLVLI